MNVHSEGGNAARVYAVGMMIAAILFCTSISLASAQERSEDRDKPTLLNSNKIDDDLDGSGTEYFYKFTAGPGKLTVTFDVKASGTNAGATFDLFDAKSNPLLSDVLVQGVDGGSERVVKNLQLRRKQDILMRIKGVKYGDSGGTGTYTVTLDGPVSLSQAPAPQGGGAADNNGGAAAPAAPAAPAGPGAPPNVGAAPVGGGGAAAPAGSNLLQGQIDPADERTIFHTVNITGPGEVTFGFSVNSTDAKLGATFGVMTKEGKLALPALEVKGGESISKVVTFDKAQTLTMLVALSRTHGNAARGTYSVQLSGSAGVGPAAQAGPGVFSGQLDPSVERPSFHLLNVNGPGQVTFALSVKATDVKAGAKFVVLTQDGRPAVPELEVQGGESVSKPVTFDKPQTLSILIQATKPPDNAGGHGTYSIQVSGPVTLIR